MGSIITLGIKKFEIDWGKNFSFNNHSKLYTKKDFESKAKYYYVSDEDKLIVEEKEGASSKLKNVKERLNLLGYNMYNLKNMYDEGLKDYIYYNGDDCVLSYEDFYEFIISLDLKKIDITKVIIHSEYDIDDGFDMGEYFTKCISKDKEISTRLKKTIKKVSSPDFIIGDYFEAIDPYVTLRILAENEKNLDYDVEWRYADVVEGGWVRKKELYEGLNNSDRITIVTEGSTDSFILKKTISELYPNISDFFTFIDMKENYPFTGVGNLCNFCQGLDKINVINNIMVIFDNDTAGLISFEKAIKNCKSKNICITHLPNMDDFKRIKACGPNGEIYCDINGKAVAIECFLDFKSVSFDPCIKWSTFYENVNKYQGSLINKDAYTKEFKKAKLTNNSYDIKKLLFLIDYLIDEFQKATIKK